MMFTNSTVLYKCRLLGVGVFFSCKTWGVFPDLPSLGEPILECSVFLSTRALFSLHDLCNVCVCVCVCVRERERFPGVLLVS